jgi:glycosyltransferase 2 family protein
VSSSVVIAVPLAVVAAPFLGPRLRWVAFALAAIVGLARIYVGADVPLDVTGGAGLGLAVGSGVRLVFGVEPRRYAGRS